MELFTATLLYDKDEDTRASTRIYFICDGGVDNMEPATKRAFEISQSEKVRQRFPKPLLLPVSVCVIEEGFDICYLSNPEGELNGNDL